MKRLSEIVCLVSESTGRVLRVQKGDLSIQKGEVYLVESDLGGDLAKAVDIPSEICRLPKAERGAVRIIRRATDDDLRKFQWLREKECRAFDFCLQRIKARNLPMKLVAVKYFFSEKKGIFFYPGV